MMRRATLVVLGVLVAVMAGACDDTDEADQERPGKHPRSGGEARASKDAEIAFTRFHERELRSTIWVMNADGSGRTRITNNPNATDSSPSYSPDGQQIVFSRTLGRGRGEGHIYVMSADGSEVARLTEDPSGHPEFSPDGKRIAFSGGGDAPGIYAMDVDGTDVIQLTDRRHATQPTWSPNAKRIAFLRGADIHVIDADGRDDRNLTKGSDFDDLLASSPAYFPDGPRIAFLAIRKGADTRVVWMMGADGSDPAPFPHRPRTGLDFSPPSFSPDGSRIAYIGGRDEIHIMNADGTNQHRLPGGHINDGEPAWSPVANGSP
jgi:Tol biopolymer transport system component